MLTCSLKMIPLSSVVVLNQSHARVGPIAFFTRTWIAQLLRLTDNYLKLLCVGSMVTNVNTHEGEQRGHSALWQLCRFHYDSNLFTHTIPLQETFFARHKWIWGALITY